MEKIKEEFAKIFTTRNKPNKQHEDKIKNIVDKFIDESFDLIHNHKIDNKLIESYIDDLPAGKAVGINGISNEMIKMGKCNELVVVVMHIFEVSINFGMTPYRFNLSILKPLIKDKSKSTADCSNLRPLAISDAISNMLERLLLFFIDIKYVNHHKQFGFKKNSSCNHALFVLKAAMHYAKMNNKRLYTVAIDASKAFDKVNRLYLWAKLIELEIDPAIIRCIMIYYAQSEIIVCLNGEFSESFKSTVGVRQGGVMSPRLFAIYIHDLIKTISKMKKGLRVGNLSIDIIGYADDILIVSNILLNLQDMLSEIESYCNLHEIKVNGDKTVLMIINKWCKRNNKEETMDINQFKPKLQNIELAENYVIKYLGVEIEMNHSNKKHIESRCDKALKAAAMIRSRGITEPIMHPYLKSQMFKSFVMSIITYGTELMELTKKEFNQIRITEGNILKKFLNLRTSYRTKPLLNVFKIEHLVRRLSKAKLSLYVRLCDNTYTKTLLDEMNRINSNMPFVEEIKEYTNDFSETFTLVDKCKMEIEIITKASQEDFKNDKLADKIRYLINNSDRMSIPSKIVMLINTYTQYDN